MSMQILSCGKKDDDYDEKSLCAMENGIKMHFAILEISQAEMNSHFQGFPFIKSI